MVFPATSPETLGGAPSGIDSFSHFHLFSRLPAEVRRQIWLHHLDEATRKYIGSISAIVGAGLVIMDDLPCFIFGRPTD